MPSPWVQPSTWQVGAFVHKCSTDTGSSVPSHNFGGRKSFQYPKTGNGFAAIGIIAGSSSYRYYLQQKLKDSLMRNKYYYIEFWSSLGNPMKYACNNVAALLTKNKVSAQNLGVINSIPQIVNWGNPIISDTMNWVKVSSIFKAIGGEQYITLGNFFDYNNTVVSTFNVSGVESSEYYIDDVSVIPLDSFNLKADDGKDSLINAGDSVFIGSYTNGIDTLKWVNQNTTLSIDSTRPGFWVKPTSNTCYILTQTVNNFTSSDTVCISVRPMPLTFLEFSIFPSFGGVRGGFSTANEINVSHFNVQRSDNGKDFNAIGKISAKNQLLNTYEFTHQSPPLGGGGLYRIEGVDFDGKKQYSKTQQITIKPQTANKVLVFPNPAKDYVTIQGTDIKEVRIIDMFGKIIKQQQLTTASSFLNCKIGVAGFYILQVINKKGEVYNEKLIVN